MAGERRVEKAFIFLSRRADDDHRASDFRSACTLIDTGSLERSFLRIRQLSRFTLLVIYWPTVCLARGYVLFNDKVNKGTF